MAVLFASRGQFDASVKLIECLIDNGDLQYGTITTTIELVLNHIVRHCEVRSQLCCGNSILSYFQMINKF